MNLLSLFEHASNVEVFPEGSVIFQEGAPGAVMYVVIEGKVEVQVKGKPVYVARPGDIVGEMALFLEGRRTATVTAMVPTRVRVIDGEAVKGELAKLNPMITKMLTGLSQHLVEETRG